VASPILLSPFLRSLAINPRFIPPSLCLPHAIHSFSSPSLFHSSSHSIVASSTCIPMTYHPEAMSI
jgi:hypothetical protein